MEDEEKLEEAEDGVLSSLLSVIDQASVSITIITEGAILGGRPLSVKDYFERLVSNISSAHTQIPEVAKAIGGAFELTEDKRNTLSNGYLHLLVEKIGGIPKAPQLWRVRLDSISAFGLGV